MPWKTHPSSSATVGVVALVLWPAKRVVLVVIKLHASFPPPTACDLVLSLTPPSEKNVYDWTFLMTKYEKEKKKLEFVV